MKVSWYYDWAATAMDTCSPAQGGEFVPIIWGSESASGIQSSIAGFVTQGYKQVLGFNEPDNATQSNIPEATAITLLPAFNNPNILVGTPATQGNVTGLAWFEPYMKAVEANTALRADFVDIHWYRMEQRRLRPRREQSQQLHHDGRGIHGYTPHLAHRVGLLEHERAHRRRRRELLPRCPGGLRQASAPPALRLVPVVDQLRGRQHRQQPDGPWHRLRRGPRVPLEPRALA